MQPKLFIPTYQRMKSHSHARQGPHLSVNIKMVATQSDSSLDIEVGGVTDGFDELKRGNKTDR